MMRIRLALAALGLAAGALLAAPLASAPAQRRPAPARDWSRSVVATPEGGFRMGNPAAKLKLVEYGSLTCGHCAHFARDGMAPLVAGYVRSGKVSYEYRNYLLNGLDAAASLVARCGGAARFFPVADKLYATQPQWMGRVSAMTAEQKAQVNSLPENQRLGRIAELAGITQIAAQHGIPLVQARRCLTDGAALESLAKMAEAAEARGVSGTPTFFLNESSIGVQTWATLEPILRASAG